MKRLWTISTITLLAFPVPWLMLDQTKAQPASTPAPAKVIGPINYSFRMPFIGEVKCHARSETVSFKDSQGHVQILTLTCCYSQEGIFLRAEYAKEGAPVFEFSVQEMEDTYKAHVERIVAIPGIKSPIDIPKVINQLNLTHGLKGLTRMNITNVVWQQSEREPQAILIVNVWGPENDFFPEQGEPAARKARYFFDVKGNLLSLDNHI